MTYCYKDLSFDMYPFFVLSIIGTQFSASLVLSMSIKSEHVNRLLVELVCENWGKHS